MESSIDHSSPVASSIRVYYLCCLTQECSGWSGCQGSVGRNSYPRISMSTPHFCLRCTSQSRCSVRISRSFSKRSCSTGDHWRGPILFSNIEVGAEIRVFHYKAREDSRRLYNKFKDRIRFVMDPSTIALPFRHFSVDGTHHRGLLQYWKVAVMLTLICRA